MSGASEQVPEPFTVAVTDADVADLSDRLRRTRWPGDFANDSWRYGTNEDYVRSFVGYWAEDFDWRTAEAAINAFPNFRVTIDGIPIHYLHVRGRRVAGGPEPLALICTHGWPWTFWEFHDVIGPLTDPARTAATLPTRSTSSCPRCRGSAGRARSR